MMHRRPRPTLFPYTTLFRSTNAVLLLVEQLAITIDNSLLQAERLATERRALQNEKLSALGLLNRKSTRLNSSHVRIAYAVFCLKKKNAAAIRALNIQERTVP